MTMIVSRIEMVMTNIHCLFIVTPINNPSFQRGNIKTVFPEAMKAISVSSIISSLNNVISCGVSGEKNTRFS